MPHMIRLDHLEQILYESAWIDPEHVPYVMDAIREDLQLGE